MKRIIKNFNSKNMEIDEIPSNSSRMHPITLNLIDNTKSPNPLCLTKPHMEKNGMMLYTDYKCLNKTNNYKNNLYIPPIGIGSNNLLVIYNIDSIDGLYNFINENISNMNILSLNRIVNSWIRVNFDTIKVYNNFLEKIYKKMLEKYLSYDNWTKYQNIINLDKEIKDYIDYSFNKNNKIEFNYNLLSDLAIYLGKIKS